jgi:hypothetical protein
MIASNIADATLASTASASPQITLTGFFVETRGPVSAGALPT